MADLNQPTDVLTPGEKPKIPSGLNVLNILTFLGCALVLIFGVLSFVNGKANLDKMEETINSPNYDSMPAMAKKFMNPEMLEMTRKGYENRVPILAIGLIGIGLCFYGALQMRQLKKQGYYLYLVGEILPIIPSVIFLGISSLTGFGGILTIVIVLL